MSSSSTETYLLEKCGPLMTLPQLAKLLDRNVDGLRICLGRESEWAHQINLARLKIGRRVYYKTQTIAKLIDQSVGQ